MAGGTLHLDGAGHHAAGRRRERARAGIGRSFQSLELFEDSTVLDNLRVASDPRDLGVLRHATWCGRSTRRCPARSSARSRSSASTTTSTATSRTCSYGKRRLLAIARAVATQPSVLLLDEPAAGLGDAETAELAHLVRRLADDWGMAILLVEHDMNFVMSVCDEIVVLDFGRQIAEGTPDEIRRDPAVIAAYLGEDEAESSRRRRGRHRRSRR